MEVQYLLDASYNTHACFTSFKHVTNKHEFQMCLSLSEHVFVAAVCTHIYMLV